MGKCGLWNVFQLFHPKKQIINWNYEHKALSMGIYLHKDLALQVESVWQYSITPSLFFTSKTFRILSERHNFVVLLADINLSEYLKIINFKASFLKKAHSDKELQSYMMIRSSWLSTGNSPNTWRNVMSKIRFTDWGKTYTWIIIGLLISSHVNLQMINKHLNRNR